MKSALFHLVSLILTELTAFIESFIPSIGEFDGGQKRQLADFEVLEM